MPSSSTQPALPGVRFHVAAPQPEEALPRMDIAAFGGMSAAGPIGVPVPVEDIPTFRDLFGPDVELAVDPESGRVVYSQLGQAVEAFFRSGGRRCWVLRLAGEDAQAGFPATNEFAVPGLVRVGADGSAAGVDPVATGALWLEGRSAGSWCDSFRVGAYETVQRLAGSFKVEGSPPQTSLTLDPSSPEVKRGDLVRVSFSDRQLILRIETVSESDDGRQIGWSKELEVFLEVPRSRAPALASGTAHVPRRDGSEGVAFTVGEEGASLEFDAAEVGTLFDGLVRGSVLAVEFDGSPGEAAYCVVDQIEGPEASDESPWESRIAVRLDSIRTLLEPATALEGVDLDTGVRLERLQFGLRVWDENSLVSRLDDLEFSSERDRFWGGLPNDRSLFAMQRGAFPVFETGTLAFDAKDLPRFPLASVRGETAGLYVPIGLPSAPNPNWAGGATIPNGSPLQRAGLERFEEIRFLDEALANQSVTTLLREANHRRFVLDLDLEGLHALLPIEEATMVALPDATQRRWAEKEVVEPQELATPVLYRAGEEVCWQEIEGAAGYQFEEALDPEFQSVLRGGTQTTLCVEIEAPGGCAEQTYLRARALGEAVRDGPWSGALLVRHGMSEFGPCVAAPLLESPEAEVVVYEADGDLYAILLWSIVAEAQEYEIQRAFDDSFEILVSDRETAGESGLPGEAIRQTTYYRVRGLAWFEGEPVIGPWSNTVIVDPLPAAEGRELEAEDAYQQDDLLTLHTALTTFCAARGDLLALLSVPAHYEPGEAEAYRTLLRSRLAGVSSYAALYHPWLRTQSEDSALSDVRLQPPDGAVAGLYARRARTRGAWIAPANESLPSVVGLHPRIGTQGWATLFAQQVNLVRDDPRGFIPMSAYTLSEDDPLQHVNVRRLLILLRRLVLREGNRLVFQPHSFQLRARIDDQFRRILEDLYERGAFAGAAPQEAFRVTVDESVNPIESVEQGRLIVEIQIAPSRPLQFLTVRLVQEGLESLTIEEL